MLPFIIVGLTTGAVYGLAGVGLVLTYRVTGIFNFAYGAVATLAAYVFYTLHVTHGLGWPLAALIAIAAVSVVGAVAFELLARVISGGRLVIQVAGTVGVLLLIEAAVVLMYGVDQVRVVPVFLGHGSFSLGGATVQDSDLTIFLVGLVGTALLYALFRGTRLGASMRAVVESPELVELTGRSAPRIRRTAWFLGTLLAAVSGVLLSSLLPLNATTLTLLVVQAFGAAALGGFASLPLTFAGGLVIGVLASLCTKWFTSGLLAGLPSAVPFVVLFLVLIFFPRRYASDPLSVSVRTRVATVRAPWQLQFAGSAGLLILLACVPAFAGIHITDWTTALATAIVFLSLGLLVRTSGQVSLCHVGFMAIGAAALGHFTVGAGMPWGVALVLAGLLAAPIGALLAIPAIRLSGLYLALATFGFGIVLAYMFYTQSYMFGDTGAGLQIPRPSIATGDDAYYYLVLALLVVATAVVMLLNRTRLGRLLRGLGESPTALTTNGTSVNVTRVLVFALSSAMAAIGGALSAASLQQTDLISYPALLSLTYFALVVVIGGREPWYAVICALALSVVPSYVGSANVSTWLQLVAGVAVIGFAISRAGGIQMPAAAGRLVERLFGSGSKPRTPREAPVVAPRRRAEPGALGVSGVTVRFGGLTALDNVHLEAPTGQITGLVGPNGAGKTTLFNVLSGLERARSGRMVLDGGDITRANPQTRARKGIGRTFQRMELFDSLSVWDNVAIGAEGHLAGSNPARHVVAAPHESGYVADRTARALELCGIQALADRPAGSLSTGQRRIVELARLLAGPSRFLLLDEPSSGLDKTETAEFADILRQVVRERGVGILLVEHDMDLVMDVCARVYVLNFGQMIFDGPPPDVQESPLVQAAYLGVKSDETVEEVVS